MIAHLHGAVATSSAGRHLLRFTDSPTQRLFAKHVLIRIQRCDKRIVVGPTVEQCHRFDLAVCQEGACAAMLALLPQAIVAFRASHPGIDLRLVEGVFPTAEPRLLDGQLDFYVGPAPDKLPRELRSELYFKNERVVVARLGHPLLGVRSLKALVKAEWILTGLRERTEQEFEELFSAYKLPAPSARLRVESTMGLLSIISHTDAVALLPKQWTDAPMFKHALAPIPVREKLLAPDIVMIARAGVPLTPAAEHFALLLQRAAGKSHSSPSLI